MLRRGSLGHGEGLTGLGKGKWAVLNILNLFNIDEGINHPAHIYPHYSPSAPATKAMASWAPVIITHSTANPNAPTKTKPVKPASRIDSHQFRGRRGGTWRGISGITDSIGSSNTGTQTPFSFCPGGMVLPATPPARKSTQCIRQQPGLSHCRPLCRCTA